MDKIFVLIVLIILVCPYLTTDDFNNKAFNCLKIRGLKTYELV